ncbi:MAG: DNA alkylation repair protein [Bacilli bacterium]|nr:DNA alkylation repair protein [Bacilli bacterium]
MKLTKEIAISDLNKIKDNSYQEFSKKLSPDTKYQILGVRVPLIRKLAKEYKRYDLEEYFKCLDFEYLEECQLYGMILNNSKLPVNEYLEYLKRYIPKINSWAICDIFCAELKRCKKEPTLMWDFIMPYIKSDQEFEIRFGLICILDHYISLENLPKIISLVENINSNAYYVEMGIAWLLSTCFIKYPEEMFNYLCNEPKLTKFVYNKTLSKITDSYRVDEKYKEIIRKMHK